MDDAIKGASRAQLDIGGTVGTYCPACGTSRERSYSVSTRAIGVYCNTPPCGGADRSQGLESGQTFATSPAAF